MKKLASALARALRESGVDRGLLLNATQIGAPAMSRYLNGKAVPTPQSLARIMSELPEQQALNVFRAYLQEIFPQKLSNKIELVKEQEDTSSSSLEEKQPPEVDDEVEDSLNLLRELSLQRADVKAMLVQLSDVLTGN